MEFKILGPPELLEPGHPDIALTPQLWCVLVSLLTTQDTAVSVDSLVDHLWDSQPPNMARETVRTYISRINKILGKHSSLRVRSYARGYRLDADQQWVDLHQFRSLKRQATAVSDSGDDSHAVTLLRSADSLWRGPALMGLEGDWIDGKRQNIEEERHEALLFRIQLELRLGRQAGMLGELRELAERHPFDEEIIKCEMTALYRCGRQADALRIGREANDRFAELGMRPGSELTELYARVLADDAELGVTPAYRRPSHARQPNTLPEEPTDFTGREAEIELLTKAPGLGNAPLLEVIEGMPGAGKTALAVRVAHQLAGRYPDAQLYLNCREFDADGTDALRDLLGMLDVPAARIPLSVGERAQLWRAEMAHRRALVVLDDVTDPGLVKNILPAHGDCLTIAISRRHATWPAARMVLLAPLKTDDATLLLRRLTGMGTAQDAAKTTEAARLASGLPLALRVVAGRIKGGDLADLDNLIAELADIRAGHAHGTETSRSVFPAFERSYDRLTPAQQRVFRLLGGSPCADITLPAAAALTGATEIEAQHDIDALLDHYLLERSGPDRYCFHDVTRSYAAERCALDEQESARRRAIGQLMRYYTGALSTANLSWLTSEWRNVLLVARYAARHELQRQCADLTHAVAPFLSSGGYWSEALAAHELALQACRSLGDPTLVARTALDLSLTSLQTADYEKAERCATEAHAIYASARETGGQASALNLLGHIYLYAARFRDSLAHHQEALDLYREAGDAGGMAVAVVRAASALGRLGRFDEEIQYLNHALGLFREAADRRGEAIALNNLGAVLDDRGFHRDAVAHYEESLEIFRQIGGRHNLAILDQNMGRIQAYKGNHDTAIALYRKALTTFYAIGGLQHQAVVLCDIGTAFMSKECYSEALVHHERAAEIAERIADRNQLAIALCGMADAYHGSGSYTKAVEVYEKAQRLAAEIEAPYLNARALYGMAETILSTRGFEAAKIYLRKAHDIFEHLGVPEAGIVELRLHGLNTSAS